METRPGSKFSFAVLGVGAIGGFYGGLLSKSGFEVHFLARSDADHLRTVGLNVKSKLGDFALDQIKVYSDIRQMPQVDCVLVTWKATSNKYLAQYLPVLFGPKTIVVMIQNGLDVEKAAADVVGADRVLGGCAFICSQKVGPGIVHHMDYGSLVIGEYSSAIKGQVTERLQFLVEQMRTAGIDATATPNLREVRWKKLVWNVPFAGLSVVLNADTSALLTNPASRQLVEDLMHEVVACAAACGETIPASHVGQTIEATERMVPYAASMLIDYQMAREMELEAIYATPIREARAGGFDPPRMDMIYRQLMFLGRLSQADS